MLRQMPAARRALALGTTTSVITALFLVSSGGSCVDPQGRYNDFVNNTADVRGATSTIDATTGVDGGIPAFSGWYLLACLPHIELNPAGALQMQLQLTFVPDTTGTTAGTLTTVAKPLTATGANQGTTDYSDLAGPVIGTFMSTVATDGSFKIDLGTPTLPPGANTIFPGNAIVFSQLNLYGVIQKTPDFCSGVDAIVTSQPLPLALCHAQDICLFHKVGELSSPAPSGAGTIGPFTIDQYQSELPGGANPCPINNAPASCPSL